jgi:hypothetical protein
MKYSTIIFLLLALHSCVPINQPTADNRPTQAVVSKRLFYEDYNYESTIKTVQLTPRGNTSLPAVTSVRKTLLRLTFDDLSQEADSYMVKIVNCDRNWKPSTLNSLEYLTDYNEFDITDYEFSFDTATPYVHYKFDIPAIKRSGNYLLIAYRTGNVDDIILTKRMMIVEQLVSVSPTASLTGLTNLSKYNQQINFTVDYPNYPLDNPMSNVSITIRQNQRNDNLISGLKPAFSREDIQQLEYRFFDHQNTFSAANEFRFFDLKSIIYPGQNVQTVNRNVTPPKVVIALDRPRTGLAYAQYEDNNGQYTISDHLEVNGNYTNITFNLDNTKLGYQGDVYLFGELTDWRVSDRYKMKYDPSQKKFSKEVLLKQGFYEYQYLVDSDSIQYYLEGNHYQTENSYEILAYYRPYNERSDLLVGYYKTNRSGNNR